MTSQPDARKLILVDIFPSSDGRGRELAMLEQYNDSFNVLDIEQIELMEFSRSVSQIEWLLLLLVILYYVAPGTEFSHPAGLVVSFVAFAISSLVFRFAVISARQIYWKLVAETCVMIVFITWVVFNTGNIHSPLLNLYFLVIICSAITLGKLITFIEIAIIAASYFYLVARANPGSDFTGYIDSMIFFSPYILIAYFTTLLVADLNYGKNMFKALSETDEMTSFLNKRSFSPMFKKAADIAERYSQPLSVMMIDADRLKEINDNHGHIAGDQLILTIASTIQNYLRTTDIICRYGGDEFVALLPKMTAAGAWETGERLRSAVENTVFEVDGEKISSTISIGIATFPENVQNVHDLLTKADDTLYESKNAGRNMVRSYLAAEDQKEAS